MAKWNTTRYSPASKGTYDIAYSKRESQQAGSFNPDFPSWET